jgi:TonB family protein
MILKSLDSIRPNPYFQGNFSLLTLCLVMAAWLHLLGFMAAEHINKDFLMPPPYELPDSPFLELNLELNPNAFNQPKISPPIPLGSVDPLAQYEEEDTLTEDPMEMPVEPEEITADTTEPGETAAETLPEELPARADFFPEINTPAEETPNSQEPDNTVSVEETAPRFKSYNSTVRSSVARHWLLPPAARSNFQPGRFSAIMTLDRNGQVILIEIKESSGSPTLDYAAMEALRGGAPYEPFPDELSGFSQLNFRINFDYRAIIRHTIPLD